MNVTGAMRILQFGDSLLPVGSFSFSNALEAAVQLREVTDETTLTEFVRTAVHRAATSDGIALLHAHRAARDHDLERAVAADNALYQRKFTEEARTMSVRMGRKLGELGATMAGAPAIAGWLRLVQESQTPGTYPVGLGLLFADLDVREEHAFAVHQYGVAMMMMSAALRLMKIDHRQAQAILYATSATGDDDYASVRQASISDMASFAPMADILAAVHVRSHVRLFMS
jgi:urease accessory protein